MSVFSAYILKVTGLNWLIALYENNINGILGDEMVKDDTRWIVLKTLLLGSWQNNTVCGNDW